MQVHCQDSIDKENEPHYEAPEIVRSAEFRRRPKKFVLIKVLDKIQSKTEKCTQQEYVRSKSSDNRNRQTDLIWTFGYANFQH